MNVLIKIVHLHVTLTTKGFEVTKSPYMDVEEITNELVYLKPADIGYPSMIKNEQLNVPTITTNISIETVLWDAPPVKIEGRIWAFEGLEDDGIDKIKKHIQPFLSKAAERFVAMDIRMETQQIVKVLELSRQELDEAKEMLARTEYVEDAGRDEVLVKYTVDFGGGIEAEIKLCNGDGPFVDPVIFEAGAEALCLDATADTLEGDFVFPLNGKEYVVRIVEKSN